MITQNVLVDSWLCCSWLGISVDPVDLCLVLLIPWVDNSIGLILLFWIVGPIRNVLV